MSVIVPPDQYDLWLDPDVNDFEATIDEFLEQNGRTLEDICQAAIFRKRPALCDEGCEVEPDGNCPHGCPSILRADGMI